MLRALLSFVLVTSIAVAGQLPWTKRLDLAPALQDRSALEQIRVSYFVKDQQLFVYGTGKVVLQFVKHAHDLVPTCRGSVAESQIRQLLQTFIDHHFFDLPERQFIFLYTSEGPEDLELHTIQIQNEQAAASRTFGIGKYMEKEETIPEDFAAIEQKLAEIKQSAIVRDRPCGLAAPVHVNH